eukprot:Clim_evm1s204 gene=Clim_evmTU1s204
MAIDYEFVGPDRIEPRTVTKPVSLIQTVELTETPSWENSENLVRRGRELSSSSIEKKEKRLNHRAHLIDSKYAYRQVVVLFIGCMFSGFLALSWGVFLPRLAEDFDVSLALASWPGALALTLRAACAPLAGAWSIRFGSQRVIMFGGLLAGLGCVATSFTTNIFQMYVSYGVLVGTGLSLALYPAISVVNQWFKDKKAVMMGIGASGLGVAGFIFSPLEAYLIQTVGWRDAFRVNSMVVLLLTAISALLAEDRVPPKKQKKKTKIPWSMFRDGRFTLAWLSNVLFSFGYGAPFFYLVTWGENHGLSPSMAALGAGLLSGANAISKPIQGYAGDKTAREPVLFASLLVAGIAQFIWPVCTSTWSIYIFAIVSGCCTMGFAMQACIISDWYSNRDNADIVGLNGSGRAIGELIGPVAVGAVIQSSPTGAFMMSGALMVGSAFCHMLAWYWPAITSRHKGDASTRFPARIRAVELAPVRPTGHYRN